MLNHCQASATPWAGSPHRCVCVFRVDRQTLVGRILSNLLNKIVDLRALGRKRAASVPGRVLRARQRLLLFVALALVIPSALTFGRNRDHSPGEVQTADQVKYGSLGQPLMQNISSTFAWPTEPGHRAVVEKEPGWVKERQPPQRLPGLGPPVVRPLSAAADFNGHGAIQPLPRGSTSDGKRTSLSPQNATGMPANSGRHLAAVTESTLGGDPIRAGGFDPPPPLFPDSTLPSESYIDESGEVADENLGETLPRVLRVPEEEGFLEEVQPAADDGLLQYPFDPPLGFAGPSGVLTEELQADSHFVPVPDRWRLGFPDWDRSENGDQFAIDMPYKYGRWYDPYNQNVLKGDYPIYGRHTFLLIELESLSVLEGRQVPTATTPFESTRRPFQEEFFGNPNQFFYTQPIVLSVELFQGDAGFKPLDWAIKIAPVFNVSYLDTMELAIVNPDVRDGTFRGRNDWALDEWFIETKLADLSPHYDFVSLRAGSQEFVSDFRGFIFKDINRGIRLFGNGKANREQFNLVWFDQTEKETNSLLNTFDDRHQNTLIANYYRQDVIWPGYTAQFSFHYNRDKASTHFDENDVLVRPDPVGVFRPHEVNSYYLGWAGDGHMNRLNVTHAFYWVLGDDELNPIAGKSQDINAQMAAIEASIDRDWMRFRTSFFWASGDGNPNDSEAEGFDAIFDEPNFAGGEFSYWQRQAIQLFGVRLVDELSLVPRLRSNKIEGQTNFVNPGLFLYNIGADADLTPKTKLIGNVNFLWFADTRSLQLFTFQKDIRRWIGADLSLGVEHRPFLNDNLEIIGGISGLLPGRGFQDLYNELNHEVGGFFAGFIEVVAVY